MKRAQSQRGVALVVVLLLLAVLSIVLAEFVYELRIQTMLLKNHESKVTARYVARAGQNAGEGLLLVANPESSDFNNEFIQLFNYECMAEVTASLSLTEEDVEEDEDEPSVLEEKDNCGAWSLSIPYVLEETPIDLNIYDEQARINLNALVKPLAGAQPSDQSYTQNRELFYIVYELFRYQVFRHELEISDQDLDFMIRQLVDYRDCCLIDGRFDVDMQSYFEYDDDDRIVPMKEGPLDTVDEIRYLPGMTDELFEAVAPFLTVYPANFDQGTFDQRINLNAASQEVLYAVFRGASYDGDDPRMTEDEAVICAVETIQGTNSDPNSVVPPAAGVTQPQPDRTT